MNVQELRERLEELEADGFEDATVFIDPPGPPSTLRNAYGCEGKGTQTDYVELKH